MTKFKVGDKVRAINNQYGCTTLENEWEGVITRVHDNGEFDAKTTKSNNADDVRTSYEYDELAPQHFEKVKSKKAKIKALEKRIAELEAKVATLENAEVSE